MCHIKFSLTGRKEASEDRKAVGINIELWSPFLQGISCPLERWGPDRNYDTERWAIRERYSWKHRCFVSSCTYKCKLPRSAHITHSAPLYLKPPSQHLAPPRRQHTRGQCPDDRFGSDAHAKAGIWTHPGGSHLVIVEISLLSFGLGCSIFFFPLLQTLLCLRDDLAPFTREPGEDPGAAQVKKTKGYAAPATWKIRSRWIIKRERDILIKGRKSRAEGKTNPSH